MVFLGDLVAPQEDPGLVGSATCRLVSGQIPQRPSSDLCRRRDLIRSRINVGLLRIGMKAVVISLGTEVRDCA